ncbi:hypothetical protein PHLCEN_2v11104 [Hermanssonia centrifuga]|uniref:SET domain-containing protein n=1 Tax=Hermanssonia centrifuga TaxID=98765 RepID=A0A2R6NKT5_9APHY|nr:hypothetical protein PHLCEN_2v11104 [Hermanssonia centrifuga]
MNGLKLECKTKKFTAWLLEKGGYIHPDVLFEPELELCRGTNLYGATLDRQKAWEAEWTECKDTLGQSDASLADRFTWEQYLTASTYVSSRAFPSTLLSETPSLLSTPTSYPILLPGVDSLNHARGQPVSWVVFHPNSATSYSPSPATPEPVISLVLHCATPGGCELFNNYGPKPNAELILGYGFSLRNNPDDTIVLKIGGAQRENSKWEVGRDANGAEPVWEAIKEAVRAQNRHDHSEIEEDESNEFCAEEELWETEVLVEMAEDLLSRLPQVPCVGTNDENLVRPEVAEMIDHYVEGTVSLSCMIFGHLRFDINPGQRDILRSLMEFAEAKEQQVIERARELGIEIVEDL